MFLDYCFPSGGIGAIPAALAAAVTAWAVESGSRRTVASLTANTRGAIMGWSYQRGRGLPRGNFLQMRRSVLPLCRACWRPGTGPFRRAARRSLC